MLFELVITLITVFYTSSFTETAVQAECGNWKPKVPYYLKNSKQHISQDFSPNIKYRSENENVPLTNLGWNRYRIAKRDDVTKDNEDWSEAFNMFDWWKNLRPNRKQSTKQKPVSNSVKRVCFDELLNAQLSNKSYLSLIHFKPRFSEPYGYFETANSPWSTAKLTEVQMDNSVKSVINATDDANENAVTTSSSYGTEKYEAYTTNPSFRASTTLDSFLNLDYRKNKNKTEAKTDKDKCAKPEKVKPEKCDKKKPDKPEKVKPEKCDKDKTDKPEKDKNEKSEKNTNRLILTLNDNKKGPSDSKTSKPFGNFSVEFVENAGKAPSIDSTTVRIIIKTNENDSSKAGGKKKNGVSIENSDPDQLHLVNDQEINLSVNEDESLMHDDSQENKTRKVRSLYPNPIDSRQFHLMHGLYSGNGAQMEDALRQAEIQALNVASDLQRSSRLRQANSFDMYGPGFRMQQEQIIPELPRDISVEEEAINERNRHSKRKTNLLPNDPYVAFDSQLQERMKFLNDINLAITKKKEELDVLERTFKNEQSIVNPLDSNDEENKMINPNIMNNPEQNQHLVRPFQFSNTGEGIEKTNMNHESLPRINSNVPIMTNNINLNDSLANNPYLESILRAYASNYLNPVLNHQNLTSPEFHKRSKRGVTNVEIERPPTIKKRRCSRYVPPNIDKENLLNSLKELEELEMILMKEYEKDFGSMIDKKPDKRWLLSGRDARTMSPYAGLADDTCLASQKCESAEVLHPDMLMGKKKQPNRTMCTDYSKKFCVLENDLIDLKNAISNINNDQNKMDKSDNDTNNIFVQVNVSVALFNGSSTPSGCECVCKRDSDSLKSPIATLVTVNKINVTDAPGQNKKTQDSKSMIFLRAFDRKRDLAKLEDQIVMARSSEDWLDKWKSTTRSDKGVFKSKSMNRTEAIQNLNEQFEAIEKTLTDEARSIRKTQKLSYMDAERRLIYPYIQTHNEYYQQPSKWDIKPSIAKEKLQSRSSRSYENQLSSHIYGPKRNLLNFFARKDLDSNRNNGEEKLQNVVNTKEKLKRPLKNKMKPSQTKSSQPYTKTFQKLGPSTEPTLYIREDNSAQTLKEMLQNENTKPEIKNFTIILNRKRKDCQNTRGSEDILKLDTSVNNYKPAHLSCDKWYKIRSRNINGDIAGSRKLRDFVKPLYLKRTENCKSYSNPEVLQVKKQAKSNVVIGCEYMKHNENKKATADHNIIKDINSCNRHYEWDLLNNWKNNDDICCFAEESPSNEKDNNKYNFNPDTNRNNDSVKTDVTQSITRSSRGLADNNSPTNCSYLLKSFTHKYDKRSTMRKNIIDDDKNSDVITDLVIPLHFVHFSDNNKSLSRQTKSIGSKEIINLKPSYSIISSSDNKIFNNSDNYLHESNNIQKCEEVINEIDSSYAEKQRQVRNTVTPSSFEVILMSAERKHSPVRNKKVSVDFSTNLNEDPSKFDKNPLKPSEDSLNISNQPKNSQKTRKLIVDLDGMEDEPTSTCRSEVYDIIQIQKQVFFRLSTPASYNVNGKSNAKKQNFDNKDYVSSINGALKEFPKSMIKDTSRSYCSVNSYDLDITSKKNGLTSRTEEKENMQKALNYLIQRNGDKIIHNKRRKGISFARKPVGRRKSFISSIDFQPLIRDNDLISLNHQVRRRPPSWLRKKKTEDFLKKLEEEMMYDDILSIEEDTSDQEDYSNDPSNNEDNARDEYNTPTQNPATAIYNSEEVEEETPLEWGKPGAEEPEEQNMDIFNSTSAAEETLPLPELQKLDSRFKTESKIRFPSSNMELADPYGEELDEQKIDIYSTSARYPSTAEEYSTRHQLTLTKLKVSSTTKAGFVTKKATIHPSHIQKQHKKYPNMEKYLYKMTRPTLLPKYRMEKPATDLIYFNRYSLKIGERTTAETTEFDEVTEAARNSEQIHQVRKLSKKFRNSASKLRNTLKKIEKHNRLKKMRMHSERKLRNRQRLEEEENDDSSSDERLTQKRIKIRGRPRDYKITNNSGAT